ncbi:hypothetical protein D3C86_2255420 [compost metagenome]
MGSHSSTQKNGNASVESKDFVKPRKHLAFGRARLLYLADNQENDSVKFAESQ